MDTLNNIQEQYENGNLSYIDAVERLEKLGYSNLTAEEMVNVGMKLKKIDVDKL